MNKVYNSGVEFIPYDSGRMSILLIMFNFGEELLGVSRSNVENKDFNMIENWGRN